MNAAISSRFKYILPVIIVATLAALLLTACSDPVKPDNLEPEIVTYEATDVTRTEAVLSARVIKRGTSELTYLAFRYGIVGSPSDEMPVSDNSSEFLTVSLDNLKPGASYYWYVEGRTSTATIRSDSSFFTTVPNDLPSVSCPVPLSTGPLGIIVSFDIVDDGGEPILEAGCIVTEQASMTTRRVYLPTDCLQPGPHTLHISGLALQTGYIITPFASNSAGETIGESLEYTTGDAILLKDPGTLALLFDGQESITLEKLPISGPMNGDDFRFLRLVLGAPLSPGESSLESSVREVDLTDVQITPGGGPYDGSRYTVADEVTTDLFSDCTRLENISLPASATVLARDAFARCSALRHLTVPPSVVSLLPSDGCSALEDISVSPANEHYTS
ncbi:MAG: leucine-rich repeat domain-containing protein, partial [Muribaculaceae bacterium]|nr:leucine-rich repeat domain-containing protein [Muribaculaceae bacterium]